MHTRLYRWRVRTAATNHTLLTVMDGDFVAGFVVVLADEFVVVEDVELLAGAQLFTAHQTREAVQVEHFVARLAHQVRG